MTSSWFESRGHDSWCHQSETALPSNSHQGFILVQEVMQEDIKTLIWQTNEGDKGHSTSVGHGDNNGDGNINNETQNRKANRSWPRLVQFTEPE